MEELLAEYEMFAHELKEFLPSDTILTLEEAKTEAEDFAEDDENNSGDTISIDQDTLVLEAKVEVQEVEEEELETYELIDTEQEIQEEELESINQEEVNTSIENDLCEEVEEESPILEEDQEIEISNINQEIEELTAEVEVTEIEILQLEKELESIIEEELITEQVKEIEDEESTEEIHQEENQIEEYGNVTDTDWEASEEQDHCDQEILDSEAIDSTSVEVIEHEETIFDQELEENPLITLEYPFDEEFGEQDYTQASTFDQELEEAHANELEYQTEKENVEDLEKLEETLDQNEIVETSEITENEIQSQQSIISSEKAYSESEIIQPTFHTSTSQLIEIAHTDNVPLQQTFGLSFNDENIHDFSLSLLGNEISALEKMLEEVESPRLLTQFHLQIEDDLKQSLEVQTSQTIHEHDSSLELVFQGPTIPEPPPYDFQAELEELEEEQNNLTRRQLLKSFEKAQWIQMTANLDLAKQKLPVIHTRTSNTQKADLLEKKTKQTFQNKQISRNKEDTEEQIIDDHAPQQSSSTEEEINLVVKHESSTLRIGEKNKQNIKQNTFEIINERRNLLISKVMEAGLNSLKTGKKSYINSFITYWNQIVELGKPPTKEMVVLYNEIKGKHGVSLYVINYKTDPGYKIKDYGDLPSIVDEWFARKYTTYFKEWLIFRDQLEGKSAFIKVWVKGSKNREKELFLIPNYEATKWNANGVPMELWKPKRSFILRSGLFTKVKFPPRYEYDPNRRNTVLIRHPVKERIINRLENVVDSNGKPIYRYPKEVSRHTWFNSAYQIKFDENLIDEYLEGIYWQRIKTGRTRAERSSLKLSVINYYERLGERITSLTDNMIESELNEAFEIYLVDESKALWGIISLLNDVVPLQMVTTFDEWIDKLKTEFGSEIARIIQQAKLQNLNKIPITFKLTDADKYQGGKTLTRDPIRFWVEKYTDGISGFAKALIGDNRVRTALEEFSRAVDGVFPLDLPLNVTIETNWAHNPTRVNIVTIPDIVVKDKIGRKFLASEIVQNKILREIGDNNGQISPRDYLLEYLKTMGEYDPNNCSIKNIQLEFIPRGNTLGGRTDITKDTNVVIISYWGNDVPQMGRVPEIIQSLRMIRYLDKIENQEIIKQKVVNKLKQGIGALGFQRKMDENTSRVIQELTELTSADGEVTFSRDSFLELLRRYGMGLVSNNYSLDDKEINP